MESQVSDEPLPLFMVSLNHGDFEWFILGVECSGPSMDGGQSAQAFL